MLPLPDGWFPSGLLFAQPLGSTRRAAHNGGSARARHGPGRPVAIHRPRGTQAMNRPLLRAFLLAGLLPAGLETPSMAADEPEQGFIPLFDGKTLDGWEKV